tara:strand:+ start:196 stop:1008 length:813 start_codon:yes stop_codon:yes gene_type:complete
MNYFYNKTIWITGASSGIGEALAIELSKLDANLILTARRKEELERVKQACGNKNVVIFPFDLEHIDNIDELSQRVQSEFPEIDILINNAGVSAFSSVIDTDYDVYERVMKLNYLSIVKLIKSVLPNMMKRKAGQIVTNTSLLGILAIKNRSVYAASKHAMHGFMNVLRAEMYGYNIKVNIVAPGLVDTQVGVKALTKNGLPYGKNDRGHATKGMSAKDAAVMIIEAMKRNKREKYIIPQFSISKIAIYLNRFLPGVASVWSRNYNEQEDN